MEPSQAEKRAEELFLNGFLCAESVAGAVLECAGFGRPGVVRAASGFGGGIGGSQEQLCGAFSGGVLALGSLLGRRRPWEEMRQCGIMVREFMDRFATEIGTLSCPQLLNRFQVQGKGVRGCLEATAKAAGLAASVLMENGYDSKEAILRECDRPHEKAARGGCPLSAAPAQS